MEGRIVLLQLLKEGDSYTYNVILKIASLLPQPTISFIIIISGNYATTGCLW